MNAPFDWIDQELAALHKKSLLRSRRTFQPIAGGRCQLDGKILWNFAGNDYLGLSDNATVIKAAQSALSEGVGARASPLVTGRTVWHAKLEQAVAEFKKTDSAILFPTGFAANFGVITSLVNHEDVVFCDRLNHASLIDGARSSRAKLKIFPHCDAEALRKELAKAGDFRRRLIITDSLFSMDGDHAPLKMLAGLAEKFDAMLLIDEAHATGIFGDDGTGILEAQKVTNQQHVVSVGTFSKALGAQGGFVAGSKKLCDWLWNQARTNMFSTALAPPICAAAIASIELIQTQPERREWLLAQCSRIKRKLQQQGWSVPDNVNGPIIPILIGDPAKTIAFAEQLQQHGILVAAIRPPTVSKGTSRLRISLSYAHAEEGISALLEALQKIDP